MKKAFSIKRTKNLSWLIASLLLFSGSCTKDFGDINTNQNSIAVVGPNELPFLFLKPNQRQPTVNGITR